MQTILGIAVGLGLASACGFRVFVPLLVLCLAARGGHVPLSDDFAWLASNAALVALASATALEVLAYTIPWVDHALDVLATPAATLAGVVATVAVTGDLPPVVRWAIALIGGGGAAGLVQGATVLTRAKSGLFTAGLANPVISTVELLASALIATLAVVLPMICILVAVIGTVWLFRVAGRVRFGRRRTV